ncbi:MAG: hypothetical protein IJ714_06835, partial [Bacteroidales bacterium]|nr:hypothetical protein [Bacteroidales bacterium]
IRPQKAHFDKNNLARIEKMIPNNTKSGIISIIRFSGEKKHSTFSAASTGALWLSTRQERRPIGAISRPR